MKAQFTGGPYDGVVLHFKECTDEMILPVTVRTADWADNREVPAQVKYHIVEKDDVTARYQFKAVRL